MGGWDATTVIACALALLGRSERTLPRIAFIEKGPPGVSAFAEGYTVLGEQRIVLITSAWAFRQATESSYKCDQSDALREVASVIAHEEWHVLHGVDENGAYDAQLRALLATGIGPTSSLFRNVMRAKQLLNAGKAPRAVTQIASNNQEVEPERTPQ